MLFGLIKVKRIVKCKVCDGKGYLITPRLPPCGWHETKCGCCYGKGKIEK